MTLDIREDYKIDFAFQGSSLAVHHREWGKVKNPKTGETRMGWKKVGLPDYYCLSNTKLAVWRELLLVLGTRSGITADDLLDSFMKLTEEVGRIVDKLEEENPNV